MQRDITDAWLRTLKPPAHGRLEVSDKRVRGLKLRVTPNGTFTWSTRGRTVDGKKTRPKIGTWPAVGVSEARKASLAAIAEIQGGGDPVAARRATRAARKARFGMPTVADRMVEWQVTKQAEWSDRYQGEVNRLCNRELIPKLGKRILTDTTRADWTDIIGKVHRRAPGVGAMLYRTASAFLNHAEAHGWIPLPLLPRKGASIIAPQVAPRERVLADDELLAIWLAADKLRPKPRAFVRLLAMTAAREMEVADIATGEIDLGANRWSIPRGRTKNGLGIVLPLHPLLIEELQAVWPTHGMRAGPNWRLLGAIEGSGFRGFSPIKRSIDERSGIKEWRWHDLRRTARTGMTRLGVSHEHAEAALNHVSGRSALERTYDRHDFANEIVAALSRWQTYVAALVTGTAAHRIIAMRTSFRR